MRYCSRRDEDGFLCGEPISDSRRSIWCKDCAAEYMADYRQKNGTKHKRPGRKGPVREKENKY